MNPIARLVILNGPRHGEEQIIPRVSFFVGRSGNNNLVLPDRAISRRHVVVNWIDAHYVLSDLRSFSGTLVNGHRVEEVALSDGDIIQIGETRCQFTLGGRRGHRKKGHAASLVTTRWPRPMLIGLLLAVGLWGAWRVGDVWQSGRAKVPPGVHREIVRRYQAGIEHLNVAKDLTGARTEWEAVLALDPYLVTHEARKALQLLDNLKGER